MIRSLATDKGFATNKANIGGTFEQPKQLRT